MGTRRALDLEGRMPRRLRIGRGRRRVAVPALLAVGLATAGTIAAPTAAAASPPSIFPPAYLARFTTVSTVTSTVPSNGDVNPYGITVVPESRGKLVEGATLISNFNNSGNLPGTGTTIVQVSRTGTPSTSPP